MSEYVDSQRQRPKLNRNAKIEKMHRLELASNVDNNFAMTPSKK
jgi:hypothetical protein